MDRKRTAWKKSRKFGDVHGGRSSPKVTDGVFGRVHSLQPPIQGQKLPIVRLDNPSKDFFFPLGPEEVLEELGRLPRQHVEGVTHIWFRRFKKSEYERHEMPLACFQCGSGVRAIILYPWPKDLKLFLGTRKPTPRQIKMYAPYSTELVHGSKGWYLEFALEPLKALFTEFLLFHEIGHHVDRYSRRWTRANRKQVEDFADQYAFERTSLRASVYDSQDPEATYSSD